MFFAEIIDVTWLVSYVENNAETHKPMSMDSYESSYREESFRPRMADGNYNPYFFRLRTMTPYSDENIRVDPNRFSKETIQCCEEEEMLEGFIDRIILTCAMKEAGEEDFGVGKYIVHF